MEKTGLIAELDFLLNAGYDLSDVEEAFGKEWLEKYTD